MVASARLPALVSVTSGTNEPRYPQLKGIMAARRMEIERLGVGDLGLSSDQVGAAGARERVLEIGPPPARAAGTIHEDGGDGGRRIAGYLAGLGLL